MPKRRKVLSLFPFLRKCGGLRPDPELKYLLDTRYFQLVRKDGLRLDQARAKAVEAGYLQDGGDWSGRESDSTINDLVELIDAEARGMRQYAYGEWPEEADNGEPVPETKAPRMTRNQYLAALKKLGLGRASKRTAELLGVSVRHIQRMSLGEQDVTDTIALLLEMYLKHGLPEE